MPGVPALRTGERIRLYREAKGMSHPVLAGLVGRSSDWLKKIERGDRQLNSLPLLLRVANILNVSDLSELTGDGSPAPVMAWNKATHPVVQEVQRAMQDASFTSSSSTVPLAPDELQQRVMRAWLLWHSSRRQRTDVGALLPDLIR